MKREFFYFDIPNSRYNMKFVIIFAVQGEDKGLFAVLNKSEKGIN